MLGLLAGLNAGCTGHRDDVGDLTRTWQEAFVAAPGSTRVGRNLHELNSRLEVGDQIYPTVLYLHGCTGIGKRELKFGQEITDLGFVFVAPDSMARRYRPLQCDPAKKTGGKNLFVYDFRSAELRYALDRLLELDWVDRNNLFLIGGSEGAVSAAQYRGDEFRARILLQWTCHGAPLVAGIAAPENEPILAVVNWSDPWYDEARTAGQSGHCGEYFGERPDSVSIVLERPGKHDVLTVKRIRKQIKRFLLERLKDGQSVQ